MPPLVCGISAIIAFPPRPRPAVLGTLRSMHARLGHRGPDGEALLSVDPALGVLRSDTCEADGEGWIRAAIAFRWLAIQDTGREALQPMSGASGRHWLAFNGEIYNFVELRAELERDGHRFRTHGDAEVILAAYRQWGTRCFERFRGMWALLIIDLDRRILIGSRDRFGIKPLFYSIDADGIMFASELKAIIAGQGNARINSRYLYEFLHGHRTHYNEETYYDGIFSTPASTWFELRLDSDVPVRSLEFQTYWNAMRFAGSPRSAARYDHAVQDVDELLTDSIRLHTRSEVKLGTFLSGGLDSTLITGIVHAMNGTPRDSYTLAFDRTRYAEFDESPFVDAFLESTRVPNFQATFDADWIRDTARELTTIQEEPLIATTLFAQYRVFCLARERGATVVLDGQGSDELFGGYGKYEFAAWRDRLMHGDLRGFIREGRILGRNYGAHPASLAYRHLLRPIGGRLVRRFGWSYRRYDWINEEAFPRLSKSLDDEIMVTAEIDAWPTQLERELYSDLRYTSLPPLFLYSDRSGMSQSVEARLPYLDHPLVEYVLQLPPEFKTGFGLRKRILRDVARRYLPRAVVDRSDKMGFATPEPRWLRDTLAQDLRDLANARSMQALPFLHVEHMRLFIDEFLAGLHNDHRAAWRLYALRNWIEAFGVTP